MSSQTPEHVGNNIVKIVDKRGVFNGTGFFIEINQNKYCITCHHCICKLNEIFIERDDIKCSAEWVEEFSDMSKDIAILGINDDSCNNSIQAINYAKEAMPKFGVSVWGFSSKDLETFPQGSPVENGILSEAPFLFNWKEENISGSQKWNKKPQVKVYVFRFLAKFDVGFSGGPVCYTGNNSVVGIFTAKDNNYGYVIPIQTLLEKLEDQKKVAEPSQSTINVLYNLKKATESYSKGDYNEALRYLRIVLKDPNYVDTLYNTGIVLLSLKNMTMP